MGLDEHACLVSAVTSQNAVSVGAVTSRRSRGWWQNPDPVSAYAEYARLQESVTNRAKAAIVERLLSPYEWRGTSVLELGCGGGHFTVWLAKRGATVDAVDLSPSSVGIVKFAAEQAGVADRVRASQGNAETFTGRGTYDFIFAKDLVEHLDDDGPFFRRIAAQLRPGGHVFLATQNDHCLNYLIEGAWERWVRDNPNWMGWDRSHRRFYNAPLLSGRLREAGIEPERWGSSYLVPWRFLTRRLTGKVRPWEGWAAIDRLLGTAGPIARLGWSLMVVGRKR
jgi:2-polyprenyl-6-hydroxyphenyl methylase/3-demethylubiquinone-9 3-methyltransferase